MIVFFKLFPFSISTILTRRIQSLLMHFRMTQLKVKQNNLILLLRTQFIISASKVRGVLLSRLLKIKRLNTLKEEAVLISVIENEIVFLIIRIDLSSIFTKLEHKSLITTNRSEILKNKIRSTILSVRLRSGARNSPQLHHDGAIAAPVVGVILRADVLDGLFDLLNVFY